MYLVRVGQSTKARLNLTIDPDIYRASRRVFNVLDMNMSGFVEMQLAAFLQVIKPFEAVMEQVEAGNVDPAALKAAMRAFNASATGMIGEHLVQFGQITKEIHEFTQEEHTDKK